jgi:hypothetical protein
MAEGLANLVIVVWIVFLFASFLLPFLVIFAYRRLRGIERALWAMVTQLDQISKGGEAAARQSKRRGNAPSSDDSEPIVRSVLGL